MTDGRQDDTVDAEVAADGTAGEVPTQPSGPTDVEPEAPSPEDEAEQTPADDRELKVDADSEPEPEPEVGAESEPDPESESAAETEAQPELDGGDAASPTEPTAPTDSDPTDTAPTDSDPTDTDAPDTDAPDTDAPDIDPPGTVTWSPQPWDAPTELMAPVAADPSPASASDATPTAAGGPPSAAEPVDAPVPAPVRVSTLHRSGPADASPAPVEPDPAPTLVNPAPTPTSTTPAPTHDDPDSSPMDVFPTQEHRRRWPRVLGVSATIMVLLAGAYVGALWLWSDRVPPGVTVAGVEIGELPADEAVALLDDTLAAATTEPIPVTTGEKRTELDPVAAGLRLDARSTVDTVTGFDLQPVRLWHHLFGAGPIDPVTNVDEAALDAGVAAMAESLVTPPVDGTVVFVDGQAQGTAAVDGEAVDEDAARTLLLDGWLTAPRPIELPTEPTEPAITQAEIERVLDEVARPLVAAPVSVAVAGQIAELPPDVLAAAASFVPEDGELQLTLDGAQLVDAVMARTTDLLTEPSDAAFAFQDGAPVIVPGIPGTTLDPDALAAAVATAGTGSDRTASVELVETDPAESTAELEALGVTQVVAEFDTPLTSEPRRTTNIINGASKINGVLVRPDEVFSLTEALGPIDAAHGFVQAGAIVSGEHTDAWGGGLSQISTTTYNAAFFAGFEDVEHTPHSEWFARYPEGREATIYTGVIDLKWRNNTPYGALIQSWVEAGRVHVRIWSTPYWTVETSTSARSGVTPPKTVYSQSPTCEPQRAGNSGFRVTVTRRLLLDGVEQSTESWNVRYRPQDNVVCGPPPAPEG